ncbi:MAG: sensor histidine kinase [Burkholderiaceae bacterium]|nr:sensor histidine kinase [Burkholderiaceae bacterium]
MSIGLGMICLVMAFLYLRAEPASQTDALNVQYCAATSETFTLAQAKRCNYISYQELDRTTGQKSVVWAKVQIPRTSSASLPITIYVAPSLVKSIEVFDGKTERLLAGPVGMDYAYSEHHGRPGGYVFTLAPATDTEQPDYFYVRMVTSGVPFGFVSAITADRADKLWLHQQFGLGVHVGLLGLLFLVSTSIFLVTADRITGRFAIVILNLLLATLAGSGLLFEHVWPEWPRFNAFFFTTMLYLRVGLWVWLAQAFLAIYRPPDWYRTACWASYGLVIAMVLLSLFGHEQVSNWLLLVFGVTLVPILQIAAIKGTRDMRPLYRRLLISGFAAGALMVWGTLLVTLFPAEDPSVSIRFARLVDYVNPVILMVLVVFHYRETALQLAETKRDNLKMRLGLEFEQKIRQERTLLIDMLTHEIRNPLTSISLAVVSLTNMLKDDQSVIKRRIENIDESVRGMDMVLERCDLMNRLDQNTFSMKSESINVREMIDGILQRLPQSDRILTDLNAAQRLNSDPQFFQMIISNLLENALKYSPADSEVHLVIRETMNPKTLHATVSNKIGPNGAPDKDKVFQRYYRNPLAQDSTGSGIGLYLVDQLVKRLDGTILFEASPTEVRFNLTIPEIKANA